MTTTAPWEDAPPWWDRATVAALVRDRMAETWQHLRPGAAPPPVLRAELPPPPAAELAEVPIDESGLGADSLERVQLATAVATFFRLYETGVEELLLARRSVGGWIDLICDSLARYDATVGFTTGGTTGEPKVVEHRLDDLWREARALAGLCADRTRVVGLVPRHHIYGFIWTVLLPRALGVEVADLRGGTPAGLGHKLDGGDLVVGIPDIWHLVARDAPGWPASVWGVTATAPIPEQLARAVARRPVARLLDIYGSTETGGLGWRDDPARPYTLLDHWTPDADGETLHMTRPDGSARTVTPPDRLVWRDTRRFTLAGRCDGVVQIAGMNVDPERVRAVLLDDPDVADAAVRPMREVEGGRLKAFVVPADPALDPEALREDVLARAARVLTPPERPKHVRIGQAVPRTVMGKVADWPVEDGDAGAPAS